MIASRIQVWNARLKENVDRDSFSFAWRDFLDGFYVEPSPAKLANEPRLLRDIFHDDGCADAFLAVSDCS